jgi:hypothetical protein
MKRSKEKIRERTIRSEETVAPGKVRKIIAVLLILSLTACEKAWHGHDGRPGNAYLALTWQDVEPAYIDAGTNTIPPVFLWGEYYRIYPGDYSLYYEGTVWTGMAWARYSWEVYYEIWEIPGERGDWYYNGANGPDNFFTIGCNPFGPYVGNFYKSTALFSDYQLVSESDQEIVVKQKRDGMEVRITYSKTTDLLPQVDQ